MKSRRSLRTLTQAPIEVSVKLRNRSVGGSRVVDNANRKGRVEQEDGYSNNVARWLARASVYKEKAVCEREKTGETRSE